MLEASRSQRTPGRRDIGSNLLGVGVSILATIIGLIVFVWLVLFITKGRFLRPYFERYVSAQTERDVDVAGDFQLFFNPINIKFLAEGLTVSNPAWASRANLFESKLIDTSIATVPLIFGKRRANWLTLVDGDLDLEWSADGKRNTWTFGEAKGEPLDMPTIRRASIAGSDIRYRAPQMDLLVDVGLDTVRAADTRFVDDIRFSGRGSVRDEAFTLSGSLMSPNETLGGGRNRLRLHAEGARRTVLDLTGSLRGATELEGADLKLRLRGANMAYAFALLGATMPPTRAYRVASNLTKRGDEWRFTAIRGVFGESDMAGRMTVAMAAPESRLRIDADIQSRVLDIVDAGPWLGYDPQLLEAEGGDAAITSVGGRPRVLPDAPLAAERLKVFDAHLDYRARRIRMNKFPISNLGLTLDLNRNLLKLSPLTFDVAGGHLASDIVINARGRQVLTDYDIRLSPTRMGTLLAAFGAEESGTTGTIKARVQLKGVGDSIHKSLSTANGRIAIIMPSGKFWTRNAQLAELDIGTFAQKMFEKRLKEPVQINCGLIAFTVRGGVAAADPILIDTTKNVIGGRGGFSFRTEAMDLAVEADSKNFSLFSAQSPVGVGGYFAAPTIDPISGELLTRAGVGLGLLAAVSPVAAVLAFVDVGDAEDTRCGPVLSGARSSAQREKDGGKVEEIGDGKSTDPDKKGKKRKKFLGIF